jgi:hypothetical protein
MADRRIIHHPAECSARCCDDPECPYTHHDTWEVNGVHYHDPAQADAMLPPIEEPSHG